MYMKDWIEKLDDFLHITDSSLLNNSGTISHKNALMKATEEYEKYKKRKINEVSRVEGIFFGSNR